MTDRRAIVDRRARLGRPGAGRGRRSAALGVDRHGRARLLRARGRAGRHPGGRRARASRRAPPAGCWPRWRRAGCWSAPGPGRYRLGLRLFEIGQLAVDRLMLRELALPVLGELRDAAARDRPARGAGRRRRALRRPAGGHRRGHDLPHRALPARAGPLVQRGEGDGGVQPDHGAGDPGARLRAAHPVHDRRPAPLPAGAAPGPRRRRSRPPARSTRWACPRSPRRSCCSRGERRWRWRRSRWSARRRGCWAAQGRRRAERPRAAATVSAAAGGLPC